MGLRRNDVAEKNYKRNHKRMPRHIIVRESFAGGESVHNNFSEQCAYQEGEQCFTETYEREKSCSMARASQGQPNPADTCEQDQRS